MQELNIAMHPDVSTGISLTIQLLVALALTIVTFMIHALGIVRLTRILRLDPAELRAHRVDLKAFGLMMAIALSLFALHVVEILVFALFYYAVGGMVRFEEAMHFSIQAFTTLGSPEFGLHRGWRIVAALEGLVGFLLIGWSTAVFVTDMNKLLRERPPKGADTRTEE